MATTETTYSDNYQVKLIGTGLESGTWGLSTNQNMERIEQGLGGSKLSFDILAPGGSSSYAANTLTWKTQDTAAAGDAGSEGRNRFVEFTDGGSSTADTPQTIEVRGSTASEYPDRVFFVKNSLGSSPGVDGNDIIFDCNGGTTYTLLNGCYAVIYTTDGEVGNLLSNLQIEDLTFTESTITVKDNVATALVIQDSVGTLLNFDTTTDETEVAITSNYITGTASGGGVNQDVTFTSTLGDVSLVSSAVDVNLTSAADVNLTAAANVVVTPTTMLDIDSPTIDLKTQNVDMRLAISATALEIDGNTNLVTFDTTDEAEKVIIPVELEISTSGSLDLQGTSTFTGLATFADIDINGGAIDGTIIGGGTEADGTFDALTGNIVTVNTGVRVLPQDDGYVNFANSGATWGDTGHGIRSVEAGVSAYLAIQAKNIDTTEDQTEAWYDILPRVYGLGTATKSDDYQAGEAGANKKGFIRFGEIGLYFDRVEFSVSGDTFDYSEYFEDVWQLVFQQSSDTGESKNQYGYVLDPSTDGKIYIDSRGSFGSRVVSIVVWGAAKAAPA